MTIYYVDNSGSNGNGSTGSPFNTIQNAFNVVNPGDSIRIRTGSGNYAGNPVLNHSGTSGNPIIIEPDIGHTPNIVGSLSTSAGGLTLLGSYITIQNLKFDGSGVNSQIAIFVQPVSTGPSFSNITIQNCTFLNNGGTEAQSDTAVNRGIITFRAQTTGYNIDSYQILNNTFNNNRGHAMFINGTTNGVISGNTISNMLRGRGTDGPVEVGIKVSSTPSGNSPPGVDSNTILIDGNIIHDFQDVSAWTITNAGTTGAVIIAIYGDVGCRNVTVINNIVYNIAPNTKSNAPCSGGKCQFLVSAGIQPESRCHNWIIKNNLVYNIGEYGLLNGSGDPSVSGNHPANNTQWINNTVYNCGKYCFRHYVGTNIVVTNNIFFNGTIAPLSFNVPASISFSVPFVINYNDYLKTGSSNVVLVASVSGGDSGTFYTLPTWKTNIQSFSGMSSAENNTISDDPQFISPGNDFNLLETSPCKGIGEFFADMGTYIIPITLFRNLGSLLSGAKQKIIRPLRINR